MQKTDVELLAEANIIKNETNAGANTATRVGVMLVDMIDSKANNANAGAQNLDGVLLAGNISSQNIQLRNSLTAPTIENEIAPNYVYMYDDQSGEAELSPNQNYIYQYVSGQDVYVYSTINGGNPYTEIKGVSGEFVRVTHNYINFNDTCSLYFPNNSGVIKTEETTNNIDTTTQDVQVNGNTINEVTAAGAFNLIFPDPSLNNNQRITIVNTDIVNPVLFDDTNTFAPYWLGSQNKMTVLGAAQMLVLTSVNGKWRGGLMYD
jgi:hypothetical protein